MKEDFREALDEGKQLVPLMFHSSTHIVKKIHEWATAEKGETLGRIMILGLGAFAGFYMARQYPWLIWTYAGTWFIGCCIAAHHINLPQNETRGEEQEQGEDEEPEDAEEENKHTDTGERQHSPEPADGAKTAENAFLEYVEHKVAYAVKIQRRKGIHTRDILAGLQDENMLLDWYDMDLRIKMDELHIPYREQLNIKGIGNTFGVHVDDLTEHLGRPPHLPSHMVPDNTPHPTPEQAAPGSRPVTFLNAVPGAPSEAA